MPSEKLAFCVVHERAVSPSLEIEPYTSPMLCSSHVHARRALAAAEGYALNEPGEAFLVLEHGSMIARVVAHLSVEWKCLQQGEE